MKTRDITLISVFAALITVCAWISIPAPIAFSLQTFGVFCTLYMLGGKRGFFAVLVYESLGIVGLPVFSGFRGGLGVLLGPGGGFLMGLSLQRLSCGLLKSEYPDCGIALRLLWRYMFSVAYGTEYIWTKAS